MPSRRALVVVLHGSIVLLIPIMFKGGTANPAALAIFVAIVAFWAAITLKLGLMGRAGPKLSPRLRGAYLWMHRLLHILLALTAIAIAGRLLGRPVPGLDAWTMLLITLSVGALHGLFHFWRHTAFFDNALRLILPKFMHSLL